MNQASIKIGHWIEWKENDQSVSTAPWQKGEEGEEEDDDDIDELIS